MRETQLGFFALADIKRCWVKDPARKKSRKYLGFFERFKPSFPLATGSLSLGLLVNLLNASTHLEALEQGAELALVYQL